MSCPHTWKHNFRIYLILLNSKGADFQVIIFFTAKSKAEYENTLIACSAAEMNLNARGFLESLLLTY